jgi:hypothetical protein
MKQIKKYTLAIVALLLVSLGAVAQSGYRITINGTLINAEHPVFEGEEGCGTVTPTVSGNVCTLTVVPGTNYYFQTEALKVTKTIEGSQAQVRRIGFPEPVTVTPTTEDADLATTTTYTFPIEEPYGYEITVAFGNRTSLANATVTPATTSYPYDNNEHKPSVTVKLNGTELTLDRDYTVAYPEDCINAGEKTITIEGKSLYNGTATGTFEITKTEAVMTVAPTAIANLTYNGEAQVLVTDGTATYGTLKYTLTAGDATDYSETLPTGTEAKTYTVYYKVEGDANHTDVAPASLDVTIAPKTVSTPTITLSQTSFVYDGTAKEPSVTVKDGETEIPSSEYTVSYANNTNVAATTDENAPTVTITDKDGGNYIISGSTTFSITAAESSVTPPTAKEGLTYNGQDQELINAGSSTTGTVKYTLTAADATDYSEAIPTGKEAKTYTVYYKVEGDANHNDSDPASIEISIAAKTVSTPTITLSQTQYVYDGTAKEPGVTVKDGETEIPSSEYTVSYTNNTDVASATDNNAPTVTITDKDGGNYIVSGSTTFTIIAADGTLTLPSVIEGLTYNGQDQALINAGSSTSGTMKYSLTGADATDYSEAIPTGKEAKTYTVYYKVEGDANHNDIAPASLEVTIAAKTVSTPTITLSQTSFAYDGTAKEPDVTMKDGETEIPASEYTVSYAENTAVGTATVSITDKDGGNYIVSGSTTFTITAKETTPTVTLETTSYVYDGTAKEPAVTTVTIPGEGENADPIVLTADDYDIAYTDNINAGENTAKATVTLKGNYSGSGSATFTIGQATIDAVTLSATQLVYSGEDQTVSVTKVMAGTLEVASDFYTVSGNTGKETGTYTVTVTAKADVANNFKGEVTVQFAIINRTATEEELGIAEGQVYGTYINLNEDLLLPETIVAYIITGSDGKTVTTTEIGYIPKNVPVLLEKKAAATRPEGVPQTDGNMLKYAAGNTSVNRSEGTAYLLYNGLFVRATNNSVSDKHIYLLLPANLVNAARTLGIGHGGSTGIESVFSDEQITDNDKWYDLHGQSIGKPTKKGLYIHQGKKVVIK